MEVKSQGLNDTLLSTKDHGKKAVWYGAAKLGCYT